MNAKSLSLLACLSVALAGCIGDGNSSAPAINMPALAQGAHALTLAGDSAGSSGDAFVGASGNGFVLVAGDSDQQAAAVYQRRAGNSPWVRIPAATGPVTLTSLSDELLANQPTPSLANLTGNFQAIFSGGEIGGFQVGSNGQIRADGGSSCQLSGKVLPNADYSGALGVNLNFSGCSPLSGAYSGIVYVDQSAPNAAFRVVAANDSAVVDFYAYAR